MQIKPIFPQAVLGFDVLDIDESKVIDFLKKENFDLTGNSKEKDIPCFISHNMQLLDSLHFLKEKINNSIKHYLNNVLELKMNFKIKKSWATKTLENGFSQKHVHSNSFLSGVYYPKGSKDFFIKFIKNKSFWDIELLKINELNALWYKMNISYNNTLFLFPSDLMHSIEKNLSDEIRYSIAFNVLPFGEIGEIDSRIEFL
jgi:uncharacterized protein (TIGR02466 family)